LFAGEDGQAQPAEVSFVYGIADNPKLTLDDPDCTFLGQPFAKWLADRRVSEDLLWDADEPRTLWTARLFPVGERQQSWRQVAWMYDAQVRSRDLTAWRKSPRTSLQGAFDQADLPAIVQRRQQHTALVHCLRFEDAAYSDIDVRGLFHQVQSPSLYEAVLRHLVGVAHRSDDLLLRGRLLKIAVDLLAAGIPEGVTLDPDVVGSSDPAAAQEHLTGLAFDCVRLKVRSLLGVIVRDPVKPTAHGQWLLARCPVRADFASGWSDTPPKSLERGGMVLNAAVNLGGEPSLHVWGRRIAEPVLRLHSRDQRASLTISELGELVTCNDPLQPMGLHKAAFFACGLIPEGHDESLRRRLEDLGGGFELVTESCVPRGSGGGASSILGATVLACLAELAGQATDQAELFSQVLYLEQLMSTGGGWQDQVGGVVGGVKLIRAYPSAPLDLKVEPLALPPDVVDQLHERCLLLYTGRTRLAKNLLRAIMGRYMSRELRFVRANRGIQEICLQMREALLAGDLDEFGWLMWMHWELLKILAPESTTPGIERLLEEVQPYIAGAKVLGAGGGGFMLLVAKKANVGFLRQRLHALGAGSGARVYDFELSEEGLTIAPCSERDVPGARARATCVRP
ncbi:MAG: hypothetical protein M1337_08530, partial [Actinobacteria bacterium]|nr:hypothetical protein [Actinomycetota bacterium]